MKKKHQWSCPLLCYMYPYPIGFDPLVIHIDQLTHGLSLASLKPHTEGGREEERERERERERKVLNQINGGSISMIVNN